MRVVSCVPSLTEWLVDVGAEVVGRTKFCVHPAVQVDEIPRIGGTKTLHLDRIRELKPDLVVANREENVRGQIEALAATLPVLVTDISDVRTAWSEMERVAEAAGCGAAGREWVARIREAWGEPKPVRVRVAYAVWARPWMVAGGDTYIHDVLRWWGFENVFGQELRYPERPFEEWTERPDVVFLPSEPYPCGAREVAEVERAGMRAALVDGEAFSWYGSRMWHARQILGQGGSPAGADRAGA